MDLTQKFFLYLFTIVLLTGCSTLVLKPIEDFNNHIGLDLKSDSLWELRIVQRGEEKFSGILVLKNSDNTLALALLDPSGIKLFEESILKSGEVSRIQELSYFENLQLPEYLGKVVYRVFDNEPDMNSCSGMLYNLCWGEDTNHLNKRAKWGPFLLWNVNYFAGDSTKGSGTEIEHHSPWIGTTFYLKRL